MVKEGLFLTDAPLRDDHGGGKVASHELAAMKKKCDKVEVIEQKDLQAEGLPFHPFLLDYVAAEKTRGMTPDYVFINGTPFGNTVNYMHATYEPKVIIDVPAHNLQDSIDEHNRLGAPYERMYPHMVKPYLWSLMNADRQLADVIVCPSHYSVTEIQKIVKFEPYTEFKVIPHGTDIPDRIAPFPDAVRFGYAGAAGPDKGVMYLLQAWNVFGFSDAEMVIAGKHSEDIRKWANDLKSGRGAVYRYIGYQQTLDNFYNGIHVYVQPSVTEGFGLEVLEAMAHGRPVIVSDGAGVSELVEDGKEGFVFKKRDVKALAEKIAYMKDNPDEVRKMAQNARAKAERYSWAEIEKRYEVLFE